MRMRPVFLLLISLLLPLTWVEAQSGGVLDYGETVSGTITNSEPLQTWTFTGEQGDQISITVEATDPINGGLDASLRLLDASGTVIAENDDAASGFTLDPAIEEAVLPADGDYTIEVTRYGGATGTSTGDYDLTLTLLGQGAEATTAPTATATPSTAGGDTLTYNTPVTGTLDRQNPDDRYTLSGTEGDVITIRMTKTDEASDLDTYVQLLDENEDILAENDDESGSTRDAGIVDFTLPYTGNYTVVATRYGFGTGTSSGEYSLVVESDSTPVAPTTAPATTATPETPATTAPDVTATPNDFASDTRPVTYGETITGTLSGEPAVFTFDAQASEVVTISVKRGADSLLDPAVAVRDSNGNILLENRQFNGPADARISALMLPASATYEIVVTGENSTSGAFVLYLFSSEASAASTPAPIITPTPPATAEATAEATVEATLEPTPEPTAEIPVVENTLDLSNATLAITLAWAGTTDFDLSVVDPDGERIDLFSSGDSAGIFGGDANGGCNERFAEPAESVYWETEPPAGTYTIEVANVLPCEDRGAQAYTINITVDGEVVETIEGELNEGGFSTHEWTLE